jgi:hypothetical protein
VPPSSKQKIVEALIPVMQGATVKPLLRRRAGLLLGRLGWKPADLDQFVEIPADQFLYDDPAQPREILYRYWIAKYPVTNSQFKHFMDAGGYDDQQWWSAEGWSWRQGTYDSQADDYLKDWLKGRPAEKRNCPYYWDDHERANPIFPVVGVSWFEAEAYCNWLNQQLTMIPLAKGQLARLEKIVVRLAREEEWERAARDIDGREYPWGKDFDPAKANTSESGRIGTTAICTYPQGATPTGIYDLSGNVWEWTMTPLEKYRVLRGVPGTLYIVTLAVLPAAGTLPTTSTTTSVFEWLSPWLILNSEMLMKVFSGCEADKRMWAVSGLQSDNPAEKRGAGRTETDMGRRFQVTAQPSCPNASVGHPG